MVKVLNLTMLDPPICQFGIIGVTTDYEAPAIRAELQKLINDGPAIRPDGTEIYEVSGTRNGAAGSYKIALRILGQDGNLHCAMETTNFLARYNPVFVFLVGIAGGMNPARANIGDVIASSGISHQEFYRIDTGYNVGRRNRDLKVTPTVQTEFGTFRGTFSFDTPTSTNASNAKPGPKLIHGRYYNVGAILECEQTRDKLLENDRDLVAVEMESGGFMKAVEYHQKFDRRPKHFVEAMVIKGISDFACHSLHEDPFLKVQAKKQAALNAAFVMRSFVEFLASRPRIVPGLPSPYQALGGLRPDRRM
ncbi:MAG: hypothetical protein NW217_10805 [Hyphomicrobiaceae bacterium]|nr:hypothetical protein [Hyphomicrobiaceae bacterium]